MGTTLAVEAGDLLCTSIDLRTVTETTDTHQTATSDDHRQPEDKTPRMVKIRHRVPGVLPVRPLMRFRPKIAAGRLRG